MSRWYKRDGAAFIQGTMGLTLEEKGAYSLVLDLIYSNGGPIADDARWLSGVCGVSIRKWNSLREALIVAGKLSAESGQLMNARAERELQSLSAGHVAATENGSKGGRKRAEISANAKRDVAENCTDASNNSDLVQATRLEENRLDQNREEREIAADAAPPSSPPVVEAEFVEEVQPNVSSETPPAPDPMELPLFLDRRGEMQPSTTATVHALPADPLERALFAYHRAAEATGWATCKNFHDSRKSQMRARLQEAGGFRGWCDALTKAANSKFLRGDNNRNWKPGGIDWFLNRANFTKIMEGAYDDPAGGAQGGRDSLAEGFARAAAAYAD
jgi:uncharacterized protein YdaU (DUF1376 family)